MYVTKLIPITRFLSVTALLTLTGCASVKYNYEAEETAISEPPLNSVNAVYVGDSMLRQGKFRMHEAVVLHDDVKVGTLGTYTMRRGEYLMQGQDQTAGYYNPGRSANPGHVDQGFLSDPFRAVMVYKGEPKVCGVSTFGGEGVQRQCQPHEEKAAGTVRRLFPADTDI